MLIYKLFPIFIGIICLLCIEYSGLSPQPVSAEKIWRALWVFFTKFLFNGFAAETGEISEVWTSGVLTVKGVSWQHWTVDWHEVNMCFSKSVGSRELSKTLCNKWWVTDGFLQCASQGESENLFEQVFRVYNGDIIAMKILGDLETFFILDILALTCCCLTIATTLSSLVFGIHATVSPFQTLKKIQ